MWLPKKLQFLVPGTPPDPPIPPLTPPRGPGEPKMAKMHSLKSNNDNECQKSHFRGVKNFDLFFHSVCTNCENRGNWIHLLGKLPSLEDIQDGLGVWAIVLYSVASATTFILLLQFVILIRCLSLAVKVKVTNKSKSESVNLTKWTITGSSSCVWRRRDWKTQSGSTLSLRCSLFSTL